MLADCERAIKFTLPAVRISVALALVNKHGMLQADVARILGIAQPEVSKYVSGKYSAKVRRVRFAVERAGLQLPITRMALRDPSTRELSKRIDAAASSPLIIEAALRA